VKTRQSPWHEDNLACSLAQVCDCVNIPTQAKTGLEWATGPNANQPVGLLEHLAERQRFEESIQILARWNAGEFRGRVAATSSK
jgi:hypothetical protein